MSRLDDLQTAAHQVGTDLGTPVNGLGQQMQDKLDEYVAAVEQAKGAGGG